MKSRLLWICLIMLVIIPKPIAAQADGWLTGCDSQAQPIIAATTQLDYVAACKTYTACNDDDHSIFVCQMRALMILQSNCTDAHCGTEAALYAATINVFSDLYQFVMWRGEDVQTQLTSAVLQGLEAFQSGDYDEAAKAFTSVDTNVYPHPMLPLSAGLAFEAAGETDQALAHYDAAIQTSYFQPLSYFIRGKMLSAMDGQEDAAAIDFSHLAQYTEGDPNLAGLIEPLIEANPFPTTLFQSWTAYPIATRSVFGMIYDDSQDDSRMLMLAQFDRGKKLAVQNLTQMLHQSYQNLPQTLVLNQVENHVYDFSFSDVGELDTSVGSIRVDFSQNPVQVTDYSSGFESGFNSIFFIAPASEPDPRLKFDGTICPGAALSRLKIGERGYAPNTVYGSPSLFEFIDGETNGPIREGFTVVDGPECRDNRAWWEIKMDDGRTGWAIESEGTEYQLFPENDSLIPPFKDGS